jgi:hypothetical protein
MASILIHISKELTGFIEADEAGGKQMVLKTLDRIRNTLQTSPRDSQWALLFG